MPEKPVIVSTILVMSVIWVMAVMEAVERLV